MRKGIAHGTGRVYKPTHKAADGKVKTTRFWYIAYYHEGVERRESTKTASYPEAIGILRDRIAGKIPEPQPAAAETAFTINDIIKLIENDYEQEGRKSILTLRRSRFPHLLTYFGELDIRSLDLPAVMLYRDTRKSEKASNGTINREVAVLTRGFRLAYDRNLVKTVIHVKKLKENKARAGFFEWADFQKVLSHVDPCWHELYTVAYITGWRVDTELVPMRWTQVDFLHKAIRLDPGTTKTGDGRNFPFTPLLETALQAQRARVKALEKANGRIIPFVFPRPRTAAPLTSAYKPLKAAAIAAGYEQAMPHDFRRTAARNLEQAGIPRATAKRMIGHKTDAMYERYNIVDKKSIAAGGELLAAYEAKVIAFAAKEQEAAK